MLRWNVALQDRENLEARRRAFRCLWMWSIARLETKAFWTVARWWKILFLDFVPLKSESLSSQCSVEKACWRTRHHGPCTKTSSARLCSEFLQRFWEYNCLFCSSAAQPMQSLKPFQWQSTWTCHRYLTFSDLASQSNQLATDHKRHWRQCDEVGNYEEQGDAEGVVMHRALVASVYKYLQTCDDAFSCLWKDETKSERFS